MVETGASQALRGPADGSIWPDGWYIYADGKVDGPFAAIEAFNFPHETTAGKSRLISRKGFTQWYALKDLSEIFRLTEDFGRRFDGAPQVVPGSLAPELTQARDAPVGAAREPTRATPSTRTTTTAPSARRLSSRQRLFQDYFFQKGRLRLGQIRNPWLNGFFGLPASLGILWGVWFKQASQEVAFHAENATKSKLPPAWLSIIPGVHIYMIYRLAVAVRTMEDQNRYRSISVALATVFALVPPFALAYLQDALNRHWLLHVKHSGTGH